MYDGKRLPPKEASPEIGGRGVFMNGKMIHESTHSPGARVFTIIWVGQFVSLVGSGLTGFALGVWVYLTTGSVTQFSLILLSTAVPAIVMSPIAGALVDRWDRRKAMILSDSGAALSTLAIAVLLTMDSLEIWHIYIIMATSSAFSSFQWPAYSAATTLLVPKKHLGRAAGMVQTAQAVGQIVSPALAGMLLVTVEIWGIILIDFATFLFALVTLLMVRFPHPEITAEGKAGKGSLLGEALYGWYYITARRGLFSLLIFFAVINFVFGFADVLFVPLVLSFTSPVMLGTLSSIGGLGMLAGGILMSVWGGPKRRIHGILGSSLLLGALVALGGLRPSVLFLAGVIFFVLFSLPIINSCSQAIWQTKTAPDIQGRVFAVRRMIGGSIMPLSYIVAGPLADSVFEPLMAVNGALAGSVGKIIGVGPGRGIGLLFIVVGVLCVLTTAASYLYPPLRFVEDDLPDVVGEDVASVPVS
jgi:DHA3 family macrolide efflux protein-like MFS transporter